MSLLRLITCYYVRNITKEYVCNVIIQFITYVKTNYTYTFKQITCYYMCNIT